MPVFRVEYRDHQDQLHHEVVEAPDLRTAVKQMQDSKVTVISIREAPRFAYEATDARGQAVKGSIPAASLEDARAKLAARHLTVITIKAPAFAGCGVMVLLTAGPLLSLLVHHP